MSSGLGVMKYDIAAGALTEARTLDEVKAVTDKATAIKEYARRAKNRQLEIDAAEIRIRAERRYGELLAEIKQTTGLNAGSRGQLRGRSASGGFSTTPPEDRRPTLADLGADKKLSARSQRLAEVPPKAFERAVLTWRDHATREDMRVTSNLLRVVGQVNAAHRSGNSGGRLEAPAAGHYRVIVIDPAWPADKRERISRPNQFCLDYQTMTLPEIQSFDVASIADETCHLFCWTTQRFLREAFGIVEGWGFVPLWTMVWHKNGGFQPLGRPQFNCEFVVYGRKGLPQFRETRDFKSCFEGARRQHSRKPDEFYEVIARVTEGPRIDVFGRERRANFDVWGDQTDRFAKPVL
jgi:N6-adenosine-specific RNA methylase IME4